MTRDLCKAKSIRDVILRKTFAAAAVVVNRAIMIWQVDLFSLGPIVCIVSFCLEDRFPHLLVVSFC